MDEVLNELGLPNEVGFEISKNTIRSLLTSESYARLIDVVKSKFNKATSNIGLDESLNLAILMDFTIKFKGGRKNIAVDEFSIIKSIYDYFNTEYIYQNDVHFGLLDNNQYLNEEIKKLQDFLRERIKELRNITNVNQLKSISKSLYDSYMMAYNDKVVDGNFTLFEWNIFFQKEINLDIERFQRLKTWMESFIKELTSPLPFSLFSNINKDKTKLFLAAQFLLLAILLTEPNRSILIRNSIELIKSIEDKNVNLSNIFLWQCEDLCNVNTLQRVEYKKLNLQMPLELINLYLKQEDIKKTVDVLLSYSNQDFKNDDLSNVYNKLNELIQGALNESIKIGLKDVNLNDLKQDALKELGDTLDNDKKQLKLKSYIDRIDMFLHCLKPYKVQTGSGKFKNFHVFYYENGMVVLDKLNGEYGSLYIMPIMIYLSILKNEVYTTTVGLKSLYAKENKERIKIKDNLANISHQLKIPLTSIMIMIDTLLEEHVSKEKQKEYLNDIRIQIENINFLIIAMLKLSRFDANVVVFEKRKIIVKDLLFDVLKNVDILRELKNINIHVSGKSDVAFEGDYKWECEAITNILKNGIEYSKDNGDIYVNYKDNGMYVSIDIIDNGKGICNEDMKHIFDRFYKKNNNSNNFGIGLSLAKEIIERDNGTIRVSSNNGTKFSIRYYK